MSAGEAFRGVPFWKMSGSGNDFVFLDGRGGLPVGIDGPEAIEALCSRTDGVGADGVVILEAAPEAGPGPAFGIRYYNRDGSRGELCGNASLCTTNLAVQLGIGRPAGFAFGSDVGPIAARVVGGEAEITLQPVQGLRAEAGIALASGELRMGFANTGVPHLVVLVPDAENVPLGDRGRALRSHPSLPDGANVNFVSGSAREWRMRTYERGVEGETLACGTGAVATAALLVAWGLAAPGPVRVRTTSGRLLTVTVPEDESAAPGLRGEGRLVFEGILGEVRGG